MEDSLVLRLSGCSPSTPSPRLSNACRIVPLLDTPSKAPNFGTSIRSIQKQSRSSVLQGVVAYVDVRTESDNRSRAVGIELEQLGATVVDKFSDDVTHFVYKDGKKRSLDMALRRKVHLVSVLWVESCKQNQCKVSEEDFYVTLPKKQPTIGPVRFKRFKSMQPKNFDEDVVLSEEKVRRRQLRREKNDKFKILRTPEATRPMNFFVAETCHKSPTFEEIMSPMAICIPDTPPSMRRHMARTQARLAETLSESQSATETVQRKFCFDYDDETVGEVISVSSDSHKLSVSTQDGSQPSVRAANSREEMSSMLPSSNCLSSGTDKSKGTDFISSEIEIQATKGSATFMMLNSSSSLESRRGALKVDRSRMSGVDLKANSSKESAVEGQALTPSGKTLGIRSRQSTSRLPTKSVKRKNSPSLDEEMATKRPRINEETSSLLHETEQERSVTFIPISELSSHVGLSPDVGKKKNGLQLKNSAKKFDSCWANLDKSGWTTPKTLSSKCAGYQSPTGFVRGSPTSSQEASRCASTLNGCAKHFIMSSDCRGEEKSHKLNNSEEVAMMVEYHEPDNRDTNVSNYVTPYKQPLTCTDSLVLETRVQKRHSMMPLNGESKLDGSLSSRRLSLMTPKLDKSNTTINSTPKVVSSPNVVVPRLPVAWLQANYSRSPTGSKNCMPRARKILCENASCNKDASHELSPAAGAVKVVRSDKEAAKDNNEEGKRTLEKDATKNKKMNQNHLTSSSISSDASVVDPPLHSVAVTSLHRDEQKLVRTIVEKLGSFVLTEQVDDRTTHVISGENRRTVKVLAGISRGLWILSLNWVKDSADKGRWLPEEPYELIDFFPAVKESRLKKERIGLNYRQNLFSKIGNIYVADGSLPPKSDLEELIALCCGKVTKQLRTAKLCVGKFLRQSITNVSEKWILDSITQNQCLPIADYILNAYS